MARKVSRPITSSKQASEPPKPELKLDFDKLLTEQEREVIRQRAKTKIDARDKEEAMDRFLKAEMAKIDAELHPEAEEQLVTFTPDLAIFADAIRFDGRVYHHGYTYQVPAHQLAQLLDIEYQTKRHQTEITNAGQSDVFYRRSRDMSLSMDTGIATAGGRPVRY